MRTIQRLAMLAVGASMVSGPLTYAHGDFLPGCDPKDENTSCQVSGDFVQTPQLDKFRVTCSARTEICVDLQDTGPFFDDTMEVEVKCVGPQGARKVSAVTPAGGDAEACVSDCTTAKVFIRCANEPRKKKPPCHDDYSGLFDCAWGDIGVEQTGNGNE